jgi:NAD(P)-dependent dehydrogenase (short-subunit alcohol dehydrogenase family)
MGQPAQQQEPPGVQSKMTPTPDCGEESYQGSGRLKGKAAVITGGDSGIGRAVAIAYAREGADVLISYLSEDEDARDTARYVEKAGQKAVLVRGDVSQPQHCRDIVAKAVEEFGKIDILVSNAAHQMTYQSLDEIPDVRRQGHSREQRRARADLDAADPGDHAGGEGRELRQGHPARPGRTAGRARAGVRAARLR